jgi:hypothetical protein
MSFGKREFTRLTPNFSSFTSTGRAWCSPEMRVQLEAITGRDLKLRRRGRPKKQIQSQNGKLPF